MVGGVWFGVASASLSGLTLLDFGRVGDLGGASGPSLLPAFQRVEVGVVEREIAFEEAVSRRRRAIWLGVSDGRS